VNLVWHAFAATRSELLTGDFIGRESMAAAYMLSRPD
jgi:hypothetical protein